MNKDKSTKYSGITCRWISARGSCNSCSWSPLIFP